VAPGSSAFTLHRLRVTSRAGGGGVNGWRWAQGGRATARNPPRVSVPGRTLCRPSSLPPSCPSVPDTSARGEQAEPQEHVPGVTTPTKRPPRRTGTPSLNPRLHLHPNHAKNPTPLSGVGCFWCLARDHIVQSYRDPVSCHCCHGSGHCQHRCKMPVDRMLTPWSRRGAPASLLSPFTPRSTSAPSRSPPSSEASLLRSPSLEALHLGARFIICTPRSDVSPEVPPGLGGLPAGGGHPLRGHAGDAEHGVCGDLHGAPSPPPSPVAPL
jgi:hypothetical protein